MRSIIGMVCLALVAHSGAAQAVPSADNEGKSLLSDSPIACPWIKSAMAADASMMGSIAIISPAKDAVLKSDAENKLEYNIKLSPKGNHVHIYVDNQDPIIERDVGNCPCSIVLPKLSPGKHTITVKEATASHTLTGVQGSVTVTAK